ncbi:MAG: hypothetical protein M3539_03080 [Acidobacteriota bacterium]|nr:hypothetical protein [Acidobacteriota bacterium]
MKRFLMTLALTCVLSTSAMAGLIPTVGVTAPPPTGPTATATSPGEIPTGGLAVTGDIPSVGSAVTVSDVTILLQMVFGLM